MGEGSEDRKDPAWEREPAWGTDSMASIASIDELLTGAGLGHGTRAGLRRIAPGRLAIKQQVEVLRAQELAKLGWLHHGFSTRTGGTSTVYTPGQKTPSQERGELNLGFTASDDAEKVAENRRIFLAAVTGAKKQPPDLVVLKQIHSSLIHRVGTRGVGIHPVSIAEGMPPPLVSGDGLMTDEPGIMLGIWTADCIPVLIADRKKRAVAAFHAGWRGTLHRIVESGVGRMRLEFGSRPEDLMAAIGPGIGSCCYAVGEEVRHEFESQFSYASELFREVSDADPVKQKYPMLFMTARAPGHSDLGPSLHLDLAEANRRQLLDAGVKRVSMLSQCTACQPERFFSHREQQGFTGRMMAVIGVRA